MRFAGPALLLIIGVGPVAVHHSLPGPFEETLPQERGLGAAPVGLFFQAAFSTTGATPAYFCNEAAVRYRSGRSPKATSRRGASAGPAPGSAANSSTRGCAAKAAAMRELFGGSAAKTEVV